MRPLFRTALLALACSAPAAWATDLLQAWQAAQQNDRELAVARAAQATAQPRRDQAAALWRPGVAFTASAGLATGESAMRGAQFSAPGLGTSSGVNFGTSVTGGSATRWALQASQPLYNPQRRAQQQQLSLQADRAELEWQAAQQALMLRTAQRYFDVALAQQAVQLLDRQLAAVQKASQEAQDRYTLGSLPITDTHEARARLAGLRAQRLGAQTDLEVKRRLLADSTGLAASSLVVQGLGAVPTPAPRDLAAWQNDAEASNPSIRLQALALDIAQAEARKHSLRSATTLDLVAQAGQERLRGSGDFGSARNTGTNAMVGLQLSVPLSTGGWRSAKQDEALAQQAQAEAQLESTREQVTQQVHAAWLGLSVGAMQVQALAEALSASQERLSATQLGHAVGDRTLLDALNAENDAAAADLALAQARAGLLLARLRLAALAGQLDEDSLRSANQALAQTP